MILNNLLFIESSWFNTVGFVLTQDIITREFKCYTHSISADGSHKKAIQTIMAHGSQFPLKAAQEIFKWDINKDWIYEHPERFL